MPTTSDKSKRASADDISHDFLAALQRLKDGQPTHPKLKKSAEEGKLRINVSTVSIEARRSRTLLATANGRFLHVRRMMEPEAAAHEPVSKARNLTAMLAQLRSELADLRRQLREQQAQTVSHFHARRGAERTAEKWRGAYERLRAGGESSGNVLPFKRKGGSPSGSSSDQTPQADHPPER